MWIAGRKDISWARFNGIWILYLGDHAVMTVVRDDKYQDMFRVHDRAWISDIANQSRAKDGAVRRLLFRLNLAK